MVTVGVYGGNSDGTELVFTMFTGPGGLDYTSLFDFNGKGGGDVFCGQYERQTETDEDGTMWTKLTVHDVYTDKDITLGVGETTDDKVFFYDSDGNVIEGKYLSKEETIDYMASAVNVLRSLDKGLGD